MKDSKEKEEFLKQLKLTKEEFDKWLAKDKIKNPENYKPQ